MGEVRRIRTGPSAERGPVPAAMMAAAPRTGTSAAVPGNGVLDVKVATDHATRPRPIHPSSGRPRIRAMSGAPSAMSPPTASSQARVGSEKKAHGSDALVNQTEKAHDATAMTPRTAAAVGARRRTVAPAGVAAGAAAPCERGEEQHRRPDQVELLLHAE